MNSKPKITLYILEKIELIWSTLGAVLFLFMVIKTLADVFYLNSTNFTDGSINLLYLYIILIYAPQLLEKICQHISVKYNIPTSHTVDIRRPVNQNYKLTINERR
ncbi:MAG: hypothetical protein U9N59_07035 [Campylobacterota bacterium]|nr:hypothetical protein [Campylobacterota bacterium]